MRLSKKMQNNDVSARSAPQKQRGRHRRYLWLTAGAYIATGTIASMSPPAYSPTFASPTRAVTTSLAERAAASLSTSTAVDVSRLALGKRLLGGVQPEEALHALVASDTTPNARPDYELRIARVAGTIDGSLFDDGQDAGLSDRLIMELAEIFGWDIDFVLDLRRGDSFVVLYEEKYWRGDKISDGDILAAEFVNQGRVYRAIGFRGDDGRMQYYSPDGFSLKRDFLRTPVKFSRVSSLFSRSRYHPILKTWRAHHGVDYDAPAGTPVRATASGRITAVGWNGGYGNMIAIRHAGPYSTLYAHLARYRAGLRAGQTIEQGEIIGYVGQTGLATAPHLHYEIQVNGMHRDPLTFKLPLSARMPISSNLRRMFRQDAANRIVQLEAGTGGNLVADIDAVISKQQ